MNPPLQLVRLLQLASPALPVGAYTYSQGLEWAVESGVIRDESTAGRWIADLLDHGIGQFEAPLLAALMAAWSANDLADVLAVPLVDDVEQKRFRVLGSVVRSNLV